MLPLSKSSGYSIGNTWGLPVPTVWYYNKTLLKTLGIEDPMKYVEKRLDMG